VFGVVELLVCGRVFPSTAVTVTVAGGLVSGRYTRDMFCPEECKQRHRDIITRCAAAAALWLMQQLCEQGLHHRVQMTRTRECVRLGLFRCISKSA
jgi:hypothetical protein